jgi:beta-lactamase regulating signal transducer with metallopeptidase domain
MTALVEWLWQGLALALVASVALRVCRRLDAASRYAIWWGVLLAVLTLPFIPVFATPGTTAAVIPIGDSGVQTGSVPLAIPAPPDWIAAIAIGAWLGSVLVGVWRLAHGMTFAARMRRQSLEVPAALQHRLAMWTAARSSRRAISLRHASWVRSACVAGGPRAVIVLPSAWLDTMDAEALDQVVMHEQAHLERFDDVARVIEAVIDCVAGWHPAVRLALARLDIEREAACDDRVVLRTGEAVRYATCLADAAATVCGRSLEPQLLPRVFGRVSALQVRVARVLDRSRPRSARVRPAAVLTGVVLLSVSVLAAGQLDPILVVQQTAAAGEIAPPLLIESAEVSKVTPPLPASAARTAVASRRPTRSSGRVALSPQGTAPIAPAMAPETRHSTVLADKPSQEPAPVLTSRTLDVTLHAPAAPATRAPFEREQSLLSPWSAAAQGGVALGNAAGRGGTALGARSKKAGSAIGGFFARTGRAIGKSF